MLDLSLLFFFNLLLGLLSNQIEFAHQFEHVFSQSHWVFLLKVRVRSGSLDLEEGLWWKNIRLVLHRLKNTLLSPSHCLYCSVFFLFFWLACRCVGAVNSPAFGCLRSFRLLEFNKFNDNWKLRLLCEHIPRGQQGHSLQGWLGWCAK